MIIWTYTEYYWVILSNILVMSMSWDILWTSAQLVEVSTFLGPLRWANWVTSILASNFWPDMSCYPLVICHSYWKSPFLMGKSIISMVIFNSYVKLPEGISWFLFLTLSHFGNILGISKCLKCHSGFFHGEMWGAKALWRQFFVLNGAPVEPCWAERTWGCEPSWGDSHVP